MDQFDKYHVGWFSGGVSSFIACYLIKDELDEIVYIHIDDHHPDTLRFLKECEQFLETKITVLQSEFKTVESAIKKSGWGNSIRGASCTNLLKKSVRIEWEKRKNKSFVYYWGFDKTEIHRSIKMNQHFEYEHRFPLIENDMTKQDAHILLKELGIERPTFYKQGYKNNNCVGCIKGGKGYWNKIRVDYPEVFQERAKLERYIGASFINGVFLDQLKEDEGYSPKEIPEVPSCSIDCSFDDTRLKALEKELSWLYEEPVTDYDKYFK